MTRNEAREIMMQTLYELDMGKCLTVEDADMLLEQRLAGNHRQRGKELFSKIIPNLNNIDDKLNENSNSWKTGRMPKVDLAIMRLAVGEVLYGKDIPEAVSVNEAINLAKKFSTDDSSRFVHGVLGATIRSITEDD